MQKEHYDLFNQLRRRYQQEECDHSAEYYDGLTEEQQKHKELQVIETKLKNIHSELKQIYKFNLLERFPNTWITLNEACVICASTGNGKSTLSMNCIREAISKRKKVIMIIFESNISTVVHDVTQYLVLTGMSEEEAVDLTNTNLMILMGKEAGVSWDNFVDFLDRNGYSNPVNYDFVVIDNLDNLMKFPPVNKQLADTPDYKRMNDYLMPVLNDLWVANIREFRTPLILLKQTSPTNDPFRDASKIDDMFRNAKGFSMSLTSIIYTGTIPYVDGTSGYGNFIYRSKYRTIEGNQLRIEKWAFAVPSTKLCVEDSDDLRLSCPILQPADKTRFVRMSKDEKEKKKKECNGEETMKEVNNLLK